MPDLRPFTISHHQSRLLIHNVMLSFIHDEICTNLMPTYGPVHKLIVYETGEDDTFHIIEFDDYEIVHPEECKTEHDDMLQCDRYTCGIAWNLENAGLRFSLSYSGTPVTQPGEYKIIAWSETYRGFDYIEHDGGICLSD